MTLQPELRVSSSRSLKHVTETSVEKLAADVLAANGFASHHTNDRRSGVPDRYLSHGVWIEFKQAALRVREPIKTEHLMKELSPEQGVMIRDLLQRGDRVLLAGVLQNDAAQKFIAFELYLGDGGKELYPGKFHECDYSNPRARKGGVWLTLKGVL